MSDTIKLIVTISKHQHEICKQALKDFGDRPITESEFAIAAGTPLDDLKETIEQDMSYDMFDDYGNKTRIHKELWEILDNIGKAESEDT